jgi:pectate lyase
MPSIITLLVGFLVVLGPAVSLAKYQGFGASTRGGAGRPVTRVTTLNDTGQGSLREALSGGYRTIVFDVAGEILLHDHLWVQGAYITLDGFSAPAPGITLKNYGLVIRGSQGAHDIIVRGMRVRNAAIDGIQISAGAHKVVIDHVSVAGSSDGNLDITESARDVTVSWSILGANAKNILIKYAPSRVTLHHNLLASASRNPQVRMDDSTTAQASTTTVDLRNNLVAHRGGFGVLVWHGPRANIVNNYFADSENALSIIDARAYVAGNRAPDALHPHHIGTETVPFSAPKVETHDACEAARLVLAAAGLRPLDQVDQEMLAGIQPCPQ